MYMLGRHDGEPTPSGVRMGIALGIYRVKPQSASLLVLHALKRMLVACIAT